MYLQITERCNMSCAHCCSNCSPKGRDMSLEIFRKGLKLSDEMITIGGGEPTLHPLFWQFLGEALAHGDYVWLATNGSQTEIALCLAKLAHKGVIGCALSQDQYHDEIDPRVINAFHVEGQRQDNDSREIRTVRKIMKAGRGAHIEGATDEECVCSDLIMLPDGSLKFCGCDSAPIIGHVDTFEFDDKYYKLRDHECWSKVPEEDRVA